MKFVKQITIIKHTLGDERFYKVYVPKYIKEQLDTVLQNRRVSYPNKYEKIININNRSGCVQRKTYNLDTIELSYLINMMLNVNSFVRDNIGKDGYYWLFETNDIDHIESKLNHIDEYFKKLPIVKQEPVKEYPIVRLTDLNTNLIHDGLTKDLYKEYKLK